jgi:hypothetical protein
MIKDDDTSVPSAGARFDVRGFARTAHGSHRDELELAEYSGAPLNAETLRALEFLRDLEASTMEHLRNVLVTATHKDARVTAFLVTWAFEKFWIADALDGVIEANGGASASAAHRDAAGAHAGARRHTRAEAPDRHGPVWRAVSAIRVGTSIVAVHMTAGLVDGWVTGAGYDRVVHSAGSAALTATVARILEIKSRHADFFAEEARRRLVDSPRATKLTTRALTSTAWPLGSLTRSSEERTFFEDYAFGGAEGRARAAEIERNIAALPGIDNSTAATVLERLIP